MEVPRPRIGHMTETFPRQQREWLWTFSSNCSQWLCYMVYTLHIDFSGLVTSLLTLLFLWQSYLITCKHENLSKPFYSSFSSVQSLSHVWLFVTSWTAACQAALSITNSWSLVKVMSIESVMPSNHLILCRPLVLPPLGLQKTQHQGLFKWVSSLHQGAKGLEFQLQHQSFQWLFRTDFL